MKKKCADCGKEIPLARLKAVPDTEFCIDCIDKHLNDIKADFKIDPDANYPRGW